MHVYFVCVLNLIVISSFASSSSPPPPPPPCNVNTPKDFVMAKEQGWWFDPSPGAPFAKPDYNNRHGVSIECCAEYCRADSGCKGFEVYEPCGISDCYNYHRIDKSNFTTHSGAYSFALIGGHLSNRSVNSSCIPTPKLCDHPVIFDQAEHKIMPWALENASGAGSYDFAAKLAFSWFGNVPHLNGLPLWYLYGSYTVGSGQPDKWPSTPASMVDYMARAAVAWFAYTGDRRPIETQAVPLARYLISNGTTPGDWVWGSMPFASSEPGALKYNGANSSHFCKAGCKPPFMSGCVGDGIGNIEPDKAADAAHGFNILANTTGQMVFKVAAIAVADTLARLVRPYPMSNGTHSPWPFRVNAYDGTVVEEYTSNVISAIKLFDQLIGSKDGTLLSLPNGKAIRRDVAYIRAKAIALDWQERFPMQNGRWTACCEDVNVDPALDNFNSVQPMYAAQYIIENKVGNWEQNAATLLKFVEDNLIFNNISNEPAIQFGARAVSEQKWDHNKMGCHTGRYATTVSMFNEAVNGIDTMNATLSDIAFRCYNWASYMVTSNGLVVVGPVASNNLWFRIQLAAFMDMLRAQRYVSYWKPAANHLFEYSCVPNEVLLNSRKISYNSTCNSGVEELKITFSPETVTAGGQALHMQEISSQEVINGAGYYSFDAKSGLLKVQHFLSGDIVVC